MFGTMFADYKKRHPECETMAELWHAIEKENPSPDYD
jgi:hypothetical protein